MAGAPSWEEPRGPHLPDRLTAVPWQVWPFVALAGLEVMADVRDLQGSGALDPERLGWVAVGLAGTLLPTLYGAALFWRHPDAWRTRRLIVVAVVAFAAVAAAELGRGWAYRALESVWPPADDSLLGGPAAAVYDVLPSALTVVAILCLAMGLSRTRRVGDPPDAGRIRIALAAMAVAIVASLTIEWLGYILPASDASPELLLRNLLALGFAAATVLGWAYLSAVVSVGRLAGERPRRGWTLATAGSLVTLASWPLFLVLELLARAVAADVLVLALTTAAGLLGPLLLLLAFIADLPSTATVEEPDEGGEGAMAGMTAAEVRP